jgi:hypothetical protein
LNLIPGGDNSDTFFLSSTHSLFFLLSICGLVYIGGIRGKNNKKIDFLHYCGDLIIMSGLLLISGGLFTVITIGLFQEIGFNIEDFYFENVVVWGLPAIPLIASYWIFNNKDLVSKISPLIAKIFTPFVFLILFIFSFAIIFSDKNILVDRELLLMFNVIIIAVLALILFSLSHINSSNKFQFILLFSLSFISIIDNLIVLFAISSRLFEFGITPNRLALTGLNLLVSFHLIIISKQLFLLILRKVNTNNVLNSIVSYLPIYVIWTSVVIFLFPIIFNFK